jgi:hypothetical protein
MKPIDMHGGQSAADWIFVHIAARRIERSPRSVRRYIQQGLLTSRKEGQRSWLVLRSDVERLAWRRGPSC